MYVCIYIYIDTYVYIYIHTCIYIYTYVYIYIYVHNFDCLFGSYDRSNVAAFLSQQLLTRGQRTLSWQWAAMLDLSRHHPVQRGVAQGSWSRKRVLRNVFFVWKLLCVLCMKFILKNRANHLILEFERARQILKDDGCRWFQAFSNFC